ncbi:hypothetical protein D3C83_30450 [compost metagenome]
MRFPRRSFSVNRGFGVRAMRKNGSRPTTSQKATYPPPGFASSAFMTRRGPPHDTSPVVSVFSAASESFIVTSSPSVRYAPSAAQA